jgi:cell division protein FtsB
VNWFIDGLHKGEYMSTTSEIKELRKQVGQLTMRVSQLVDEVSSLQKDTRRFKEDVAKDVKYLTERVDS